eukprot:8423794-Pyramimonas_sp.AAC.1
MDSETDRVRRCILPPEPPYHPKGGRIGISKTAQEASAPVRESPQTPQEASKRIPQEGSQRQTTFTFFCF